MCKTLKKSRFFLRSVNFLKCLAKSGNFFHGENFFLRLPAVTMCKGSKPESSMFVMEGANKKDEKKTIS